MGWYKNWKDKRRDKALQTDPQSGAKSYSVQLLVGDEGFMVAQNFTGGDLYVVLTQAIWTYICASRISQDIASFPAIVQTRRAGTRQWVTDPEHQLNDVLERPYGASDIAPRWNWFQSISAGVLRQELSGNQFYRIESAPGRLLMLALYMRELRAYSPDPITGLFAHYVLTQTNELIPTANIVNIMGANPSSWWEGVDATKANEQATRVNYSADRRNRYDLETRVQPGVVFKVESLFTMSDEQRTTVETLLETTFEGASKQGKSLVIGDNVTIEGAPLHPVDDIPTKDANARDKVISSYAIQPPMVGVLDKANYSNLDKFARLQFSNCIGPRLLNIYGTINSQAITPIYGRDVRLWFDMVQSPLGMVALAERAEVAAGYQSLGWPAAHLNERFALEMDEFEGWDKPNMPAVVAGRVPGEGSGDPAPDTEDESDDTDSEDE